MVTTLRNLYLGARRKLLCKEDRETAEFYAQELVSCVTGKKKDRLLYAPELYVGDDACERVEAGVARLLNDEPLAYVLGEWDFYGMTLKVTPDVLIPRDDTCAVTDLVIENAKAIPGEKRILDLCTGSGCIGLAVAKNVPNAKVTLADISRKALAVAKENVTLQKLSGTVTCTAADALKEPAAFLGKFDIIVSNPPYITSEEMKALPKSVDFFEPHLALHGGDDGLIFYRNIAKNYRKALKLGGILCFEFGEGQGNAVAEILNENGFTVLKRTEDYNHRERAISARYEREDK
ncbi:MAG: peptide chain release factor N(5)-glutamine methyltransferase [Oscillospiraceae bacterium]|nr:peptide chain release factor N(5)-glutamine methyltransferase [Oscillospiraceae bacterium]